MTNDKKAWDKLRSQAENLNIGPEDEQPNTCLPALYNDVLVLHLTGSALFMIKEFVLQAYRSRLNELEGLYFSGEHTSSDDYTNIISILNKIVIGLDEIEKGVLTEETYNGIKIDIETRVRTLKRYEIINTSLGLPENILNILLERNKFYIKMAHEIKNFFELVKKNKKNKKDETNNEER